MEIKTYQTSLIVIPAAILIKERMETNQDIHISLKHSAQNDDAPLQVPKVMTK
jgi:hypothetical protein